MVSLSSINSPLRWDVISLSEPSQPLPKGWDLPPVKLYNREFKVYAKIENYLPLSVRRVAEIALALILTIVSCGTLLLLQQVRDLYTGRKVLIIIEKDRVYDILKFGKQTQIDDPDLKAAIENTSPIASDFTSKLPIEKQIHFHQKAKVFLKKYLEKIGATVDFISSDSKLVTPKLETVKPEKPLDPTVFSCQITPGVKEDILKDGQRKEDNVILYAAASQFNGSEAPSNFTVPPGYAHGIYSNDVTQGPAAQLSFSKEQVELINCGGNIGFNALSNVLDESTKDTVKNGYFIPTKDKATKVIEQLQTKGHLIEYPCISSIPNKGSKEVYEILVAAPAFGYGGFSAATKNDAFEIQFLCALHSYRAQFKKSVELAQTLLKPVQLKTTGVGLGVFENNPFVVALAFYQAASEYQQLLKDNKVEVLFQLFNKDAKNPDSKAYKMATKLGLELKKEAQKEIQ